MPHIDYLRNPSKLQESNQFPAVMASVDLENFWQFDLDISEDFNFMLEFLCYKKELQSETFI